MNRPQDIVMIKFLSILFFIVFIASCSTTYEVVMPYKNLRYSGYRLLPIKTNESEFSFRAWISNSTSIDRVISISKDSGEKYEGTLIEIGKKFNGKKHVNFYNQIPITPASGFEDFINKLYSLKIDTMTSQPCCIGIAFDEPFSIYVIEIKTKTAYNCFRFDTNYPLKEGQNDTYTVTTLARICSLAL